QCLRQRTGRDNQRSVQNGSDSPQSPLENQGRRGTGHTGMGVLVQPSTSAGIDRRHPAGRSRRKVLSTTCSTRCGTCFTLTKQPPRFPVRFTHRRPYGMIWVYWIQASFPWGLLALAALGGAVFSPRLRSAAQAVYRDPLFFYWVTAA